MKLTYWHGLALLMQWGAVLWLNLRMEADVFNQLVLVPLLLLLSLVLLIPGKNRH